MLNLKQMIEAFVRHRREIVTRRTVYLLRKAPRARSRARGAGHCARHDIDEVIEMIKLSPTAADARGPDGSTLRRVDVMAMLEREGPTPAGPMTCPRNPGSATASIIYPSPRLRPFWDLRLHRLTGLEHEKLLQEYADKIAEIADYLDILGDPDRLKQVIREELEELVEEFGDERRTQISDSAHDLTVEDLITEEERAVTISHGGCAKTQSLTDYQAPVAAERLMNSPLSPTNAFQNFIELLRRYGQVAVEDHQHVATGLSKRGEHGVGFAGPGLGDKLDVTLGVRGDNALDLLTVMPSLHAHRRPISTSSQNGLQARHGGLNVAAFVAAWHWMKTPS